MLSVRLMKCCLKVLGLLCFLPGLVLAESQVVVQANVVEDDDSVYPNFLYVAGELAAASYVDRVIVGDYGYFFSNDKGHWAYITETKRTDIQRLGKGDYLIDTFNIKDVKGVVSVVVIKIVGVNDKAVISGNNTAVVWEDKVGQSGLLRAWGRLKVSDADDGESFFIASSFSTRYGQLRINNAGIWVYAAKNGLPIVQALAGGASLTESFVVKSIDGTSHKVVVTIQGVNDVAQVSGVDTGTVTEDDDNQYKGLLLTSGELEVTDNDSGEAGFVEDFRITRYGYFFIDDAGEWAYLAINRKTDIQALSSGDFLEESFSVSTIDGTSHEVKVKILGVEELAARKPVRLTWTAPVARENGDPLLLSEIAGYRMYYGHRSGDYIYDINIEGGEAQSFVPSNLGLGTYYIAITAYDSDGRESQYSDEFVLTLK